MERQFSDTDWCPRNIELIDWLLATVGDARGTSCSTVGSTVAFFYLEGSMVSRQMILNVEYLLLAPLKDFRVSNHSIRKQVLGEYTQPLELLAVSKPQYLKDFESAVSLIEISCSLRNNSRPFC
jgi:hypothetical protein